MAIRRDYPVDVPDEIVVAKATVDTIGGVTTAEIVMIPERGRVYFDQLREEGWTVTRYRRVEEEA